MICSAAYTVLFVGLASRVLAGPSHEPYQPSLARMSTRDIIGLHRRDVEGYSPTEQLCGAGNTCADACGKGFKQCKSKDSLTHCYNSSKKQTCCPNGSGDSCDNGYFCTADEDAKTWCCPNGLSLKECAQKYDIPGPLTSQVLSTSTTTTTKATSTKHKSSEEASTTEHTSIKESTTTSTKTGKTESAESTTISNTSHPESTSESKLGETSTTASSLVSTTTLIGTSSAPIFTEAIVTQTPASDSVSSSTTPASSTSSIGQSGSGSHGPTNSLMLFLAGALAALI